MSLGSERTDDRTGRLLWIRRHPARYVLAVSLVLLAALAAFGALAPWVAAVAGAIIAAVGLLGPQPRVEDAAIVQGTVQAGGAPSAQERLIVDLIAALPDPVVVLDREGAVVAFNQPAAELAPGLRRGEPALFALRMPAVIEAVRRAAASGEPQRAEFSERVPVDRWYEAHVLPMDPGGAQGRRLLFLTFRDLTPLRQVEEMRADFVANASHELRTPLAALSGFIDTLVGPARDDQAARERFLAIMKAQAGRMARLIDDLLSLSRIELNAHIRPDTPVEIVAIVRQVVDGLQMLAKEREVAVSIAAGPRLTVIGDRDELIRVFENLVENALKYGGSGRRVEITAEAGAISDHEPGEARVSIRDYGPGIAPEHLPRLTERFYRVDVSHSRAEGGTGLGLALVKHILNRHRGRLTIESTLGAGSTFTVSLPMTADKSAPVVNSPSSSAA